MSRQIVAVMLASAMALTPCTVWGEPVAQPQGSADQQAMDKLVAPVALYPDALLAQTLACATSPDQVSEVSEWLTKNSQVQGSDLQQAAEQAGFDASFVAIVLFPDVLKLLADNKEWTTELGKAFLSDQKAVLSSAQRLRGQAQAAGNLKTTPQQEVKTETSGGQQVIVIQPANPQVVYVPQYDPQTVYTSPPPQQQQSSSSGNSAAAGLIGFTAGILLGAAVANNNDYGYYGWGAWGCSWHTSAVVVRGGAWRVPPRARYPYTRPVAGGYRAPANVYAPRHSNVNVNRNVNVNNVNVNRPNRTVNNTTNNVDRTPRPTTASSTRSTRPAQSTTGTRQPQSTTGTRQTQPTAGTSDHASRGRSSASTSASPSPARQMETGARTSAFSGYQNGSAERQASDRGSRSSHSSSSGGGRRRN